MTRVCLVGSADCDLRTALLSRETARNALSTYRLDRPYANTVAIETISLGTAVSLLNDLNWYLIRYTDTSLVLEPSISETEWLSRELASAIRDGAVDPGESGQYLMVYGVVENETENETDTETETEPRLVEPMYVTRGETIPDYDLRDVEETLVVRVSESEFGG